MVRVKLIKNVFENEIEEFSINANKNYLSEIEKHINKNTYAETLVECYDTETGESYFEPATDTPSNNVVIFVNDKEIENDYIPQDEDVLTVIFMPSGEGINSKTIWAGAGIGAVAGLLLAVIAIAAAPELGIIILSSVGETLFTGAFFGAGVGAAIGLGIEFNKKYSSNSALGIDSKNSGKNLPDVRGSNNTSLRNNNYPFVLGKHLVTPQIVGTPYTYYTGENGKDAYIRCLYCVGYAPLKLTDFKLGEYYLAYNQNHNDIERDTVVKGILRGYSTEDADDGDILDLWEPNDISLEIIQQTDSSEDYGMIYPDVVDTQEINADCLYVVDKTLSDLTKTVYKGYSFPNTFKTNGVYFTDSCPMSFTINLDFPTGLYQTYSYTQDNVTSPQYEHIPFWVCIQARPYSSNNISSQSDGSDFDDWTDIEIMELNTPQGAYVEQFTSAKASYDREAHQGNDFTNLSTTDIYGDFIGEYLFNFASLGGNKLTEQIRLPITVNLDKMTCKRIIGDESNPGNIVEIRVLKVSPNYLDMNQAASNEKSAYSYSDIMRIDSIVTTSFDKEQLEKNDILVAKKVQNKKDLKKFCYVAIEAKADGVNISGSLPPLSCTAQSFSPYWDTSNKKIMPEGIHKVINYYGYYKNGQRVKRSNDADEVLLTDSAGQTAKEKYEAARRDGLEWYAEKAGTNFTNLIKDIVFNDSTTRSITFHGSTVTVTNWILPDSTESYLNNSAVSGFLLACFGAQNGPCAIGIEDIDVLSINDWYSSSYPVYDGTKFNKNTVYRGSYYYKDDSVPVYLEANAYIYEGLKLEDLLTRLAFAGRAIWTLDEAGRIKIVMDKPVDYPKGVISSKDCVSMTNTFSFDELPAGLFLSYANEDDGYEQNTMYCWSDGNKYENYHGAVEPYSISYVTNAYQTFSLGRYLLANRLLQKEALTRKIGPEGFLYNIGDVVLVQSEDLLIGDSSGRIQEVLEDNGIIYGFVTDSVYEYTAELDEYERSVQGVTVLQAGYMGKSRAVTLTLSKPTEIEISGKVYELKKGITNVVLFSVPVARGSDNPSTSVDNKYNFKTGDVVLFGLVDRTSAPYRIIKIKPEKKGYFTETLVPYTETLYNYGVEMPTLQNYSAPQAVEIPPVSLRNIPDTLVEKNNIKSEVFGYVDNLYSNRVITLYKETNQIITQTGITADLIYNFATKEIIWGTTGTANGWATTFPANPTNQVWVTTATAAGKITDTIEPNEWATPIVMGMNGSNGYNTYTLRLYKRYPTQPATLPDANLVYDFVSGTFICSSLNGWSDSMPDVAQDGNPCWEIHATALSTSLTDTIIPSEWSTPVQITQDGITEEDVLALIQDVQVESPNVYSTPDVGLIAVDDNGIVPVRQTVDMAIRVVQCNEDLDAIIGTVNVPSGVTVTRDGNTLHFSVEEGTRLLTSSINVPIQFYAYTDNRAIADPEGNLLTWYECQSQPWYGEISSTSSIPSVQSGWFKWTGSDTSSELVDGGTFVQNTYYYYDTKWKVATAKDVGIAELADMTSEYDLTFTLSPVKGGRYWEGISSTSNIPASPVIGDYFTWTGTNDTVYASVQGGVLKTGKVYNWRGAEWVADNSNKHRAEALQDLLSVAEEQLLSNNSDVTEMVKDLIAMNVVTQNIKVTGEALINSAIIAELTLGNTQNPNSGTIKSYNFSAGSSGFRLSADGTFEAQNATIRGAITADSLSLGTSAKNTIDGEISDVVNTNYIANKGFVTSSALNDYALKSQTSKVTQGSSTTVNGVTYTSYTVSFPDESSYTYYVAETGDDEEHGFITVANKIGSGDSEHTANPFFTVSKQGLLQANNAWIRGTIYATDGSFTGTVTANEFHLGENAGITKGENTEGYSYFGLASDGTLTVRNINAISGKFIGNVSSYKSVNPSSGDLAISMGVNPKNDSDDIINLNVQSYCGDVQYRTSGRTYYKEIWKKELYTKNNGIDTDININGNLTLSGGISSFSPDFFAGAYFSNLKLNATIGLSLNNYNSAYVYNKGYIYLFQSATMNPEDLLVLRAEYSENMTFTQIGLVGSIGIVRDAILYKNSMYVATDTGVYRVTYYHNEVYTTDITTTYKPRYLSIINGLLNVSYDNSGFVFYDGTNFTTKSVSDNVPYYNLCEFTDGIYTTSSPATTSSGGFYSPNSLVCFFDKNLNFIGSKYIDSGKLILEDGTEKSICGSTSIFSSCGRLFTVLEYYINNSSTGITFAVSEDAGNTWHKIDGVDIDFLGFKFFNYKNVIVIKDEGEYIYSTDGGKSFTEIDNEGSSSHRNGSAFIFTTTDGIYKDIIIPSAAPQPNVNFDRIRQTNIAKGIVANNGTAYSRKGNMTMANGLKIQWGRIEKGSDLAANSTWSGTVTFDVPFTSQNYVTTVGIDTTDTTSGRFATGIETALRQETDSFEFQCYCRNGSTTSYQPVLNWVAIGY